MYRFPLAVIVPLSALGLVAAGCGGSSDDSGATSTEEWASGLCSAAQSWTDELQAATSSLSGVLSAVSTISGTLVTMGNQISSTFQTLQQLDEGKGELEDAFKSSSSCQSLTNGS